MELPVLDKFCFIFDLKTGCIVMGILNSIITLILGIVMITFATQIRDASDTIVLMNRDESSGMSNVVYTIVVLMSILLIIKFVLDLVFVYAVIRGKRGIMTKFCIFWIIFLVLFSIGFLKTLFHMYAGHVIAQILFLAENFYYIIVIRSYLLALSENGTI